MYPTKDRSILKIPKNTPYERYYLYIQWVLSNWTGHEMIPVWNRDRDYPIREAFDCDSKYVAGM